MKKRRFETIDTHKGQCRNEGKDESSIGGGKLRLVWEAALERGDNIGSHHYGGAER